MRLRLLAFALALTCPSGLAVAQGDPKECASQKDDAKRLLCYDLIFKMTTETQPPGDTPGAWRMSTDVSKIDDSKSVFLSVEAEETVNCGWNRGGPITLLVRCKENTTALVFLTGCHMTSSTYNDNGHVTIRLDDEKAQTLRMEESTNNRSLGLWSGGRSIPVIKQMFGKKQMIARMRPFNENAFTVTFNISGLEEASKPLRNACGW